MALLKNGVKQAPGGYRPGAGRKPDWFKAKMRQIASRKESIEFIEGCIDGKKVDRIVHEGKIIPAPPPANVKLAAWIEAKNTGYGKPHVNIEHTGINSIGLPELLLLAEQSRAERGLDD